MSLGSELGERYRVVRELGESGNTFLAQDVVLKRPVVVKRVAMPEGDDWRSRTEVRRAARLTHPGIAAILDVLEGSHDGRLLVIREYVDGPTLAERIAEEGTLPARDVRRMGGAVAAALAAAHEVNVLHGDLRPEKIVVAADGEPRLLDVGLHPAGWVDELSEVRLSTGSPAYCSPEVAQGAAAAAPADCWALGVCLFEALEGCAPIRRFGSLSATMQAIAVHTPARSTDPGELGAAIDALLAVDPERRATAAEAAAALNHAVVPADVTEPLPRRAERRRKKRGGAFWWLAGAAVLALLGVAALAGLLNGLFGDAEPHHAAAAPQTSATEATEPPPAALGQTESAEAPRSTAPVTTSTSVATTSSSTPSTSTSTSASSTQTPTQSSSVITATSSTATRAPSSTTTRTTTVTVTSSTTVAPPSSTTHATPRPTSTAAHTPPPPATHPVTSANAPYVKTWSGSVLGTTRPYQATVTVRQAADGRHLAASFSYTYTDSRGGGCHGTWAESGRSGSTVRFTETVVGGGDCESGVTVTLRPVGSSQRYGVDVPGQYVFGYLS